MDREILEFLKEFKSDVNQKFSSIEQRFQNLDQRFDNVDQKFINLETQISENTQILKALEHNAEVNKSEHDKMQNDIIHIQGDLTHVSNVVDFIKKDLSRVEEATANNWADIARLKRLNNSILL